MLSELDQVFLERLPSIGSLDAIEPSVLTGAFIPTRQFTDLPVVVSTKGQDRSKHTVQKRDLEPFAPRILKGIDCVIVGLGIDCFENGRFVCSDTHHSAMPNCLLFIGWSWCGLDVSQQVVIFTLQCLMVPRLASKVEHQLHSADHGHDCRQYPRVQFILLEQVANCSSSKNHNRKIEHSIVAFQVSAPGRVIEGVAQNIKANVLEVLNCHFSLFGGGVDGDAGVGCLGPTCVPGLGCLGPIEWVSTSPQSCGTINAVSIFVSRLSADIECVSDCWLIGVVRGWRVLLHPSALPLYRTMGLLCQQPQNVGGVS